MPSHRKPRHSPLTGSTARTAATLAIAGAATVTSFDGTGQADPRLTPAQVKDRVERLYQEAEVATEDYNGAQERLSATREEMDALRDKADRGSRALGSAKAALGALAATQYRSGGISPTVRLALSASPKDYLDGASTVDRAGDRQAAVIADYTERLGEVRRLRERSEAEAARLEGERASLQRHRTVIVRKLADAEELLDRLTEEQRQRLTSDGPGADGRNDSLRADGAAQRGQRGQRPGGALAATGSRAARAVSFAYGALGKPYAWGATGPSAYDCSGLTQAAWRSAGVSLPRTTYTQINAGRRVERGELAPGDLVFFYSGVSHVGIYVGGGRMIHAPHPGAPVRIAPIDRMPFAGAARPA